ncbi:MAG: RNB domain-containing ribonuclease, partial [Acetivibrio sp.]
MLDKERLEEKKSIIYNYTISKEYRPIKFKEMVGILQVPRNEKEDLKQVIDSLCAEGKLSIDEKGKIKPLSGDLLTGIFCGTQKGYGFVTIEGEKDDIFIPDKATKGALNGDKVQVELVDYKGGKRKEGRIASVLERETSTVVGTYTKSNTFGFVVADNLKLGSDIFIPLECSKGAVTGHKVVAEITSYGDNKKNPEGKIIEILGHMNDPGVDIISIVRGYGLPEEFPEEVIKQTDRTPDEISTADIGGRCDLRQVEMVTIDGEDAKDLDDAVSLTKEGKLYKLGVHIADVSHYVTEKSALDEEALKRGTSVYLVDRVIPMLPHKLSNGICSLNAGVDRLALSCLMDIDDKGKVVSHKIVESVINVNRRMTYTSVKKILEDNEEEEIKEYESLVPMFERMQELANILREKRRERGSIDF